MKGTLGIMGGERIKLVLVPVACRTSSGPLRPLAGKPNSGMQGLAYQRQRDIGHGMPEGAVVRDPPVEVALGHEVNNRRVARAYKNPLGH